MSLSAERLASIIHRCLTTIINNTIRNDSIGYINLTDVRVTRDHSQATVFYTILEDSPSTISLLEGELGRFKGQIKKELAGKLKNARTMPDLIFKYDTSLQNGNKIEHILDQIIKQNPDIKK